MDPYAARLDAARRWPAEGGRVERVWGPPSGGDRHRGLPPRPPHAADGAEGRGGVREERAAFGGNAAGAGSGAALGANAAEDGRRGEGGRGADGRGKAEQDSGGGWGWWWRSSVAVARRGVAGERAAAGAAGASSADGGVPGSVVARDAARGGGEVGTKRPPPPHAHHPPPKRTAVSARREFPPGCGRDAAAPLGRAVSSSPRFQAAAAAGAGDSPDDAPDSAAASPRPPPPPPPLAARDGGGELMSSGAASLGPAACANSVVVRNVPPAARLLAKRRTVSAHRSFPPGCGRPLLSVQVRVLVESGRGDGNRSQEMVADGGGVPAAADEQGMEIVAAPYIGGATVDGAGQDDELEEGEIPPAKEHPAAEKHIILSSQQVSVNVTLHKPAADCRHEASVPATDAVEASVAAEDFKVMNSSARSSSCNVSVQSLSEDPSEEEEDLKRKRVSETPKTNESSDVAARIPGEPAMRRRKVMFTARKSVRPPKMIKKSAVSDTPHTPFSENREKKSEPGSTNEIEDTDEVTKDLVKQALMSSEKCPETQGKEAATVRGYFGPRNKVKVKDPKSKLGRRVTTNVIQDIDEFATNPAKQALMSSEKRPMTQGKEASTVRGYFGPRKVKVKVPVNLPIKVNLTCKLGSKDKLNDKVTFNLEDDDILKGLAVREGKLEFYLKSSTPVPSMKCQRQYGVQNADARSKVKMMCRRFEAICRTIAQAVDERSLKVRRIDIEADKAIKELPDFTKHGPIVGEVPGVQVGDEFLYRVELAIVGLHRPYQGGIDWTKDRNGALVAISVVASGGYPDERCSSGELVYTGSGGKHAGRNSGGDQKLERGNLALKNCISRKGPVRVIHGFKRQNIEEGSHSRAKEITTFTYDGLYHVVDCWREGQPGSEVFKFKLQRIPGQPELPHCRKKWIMS